METNCGRILIIPKGEYSNTTEYEQLDLVEYQGSSYIAKQTTIGHLPTDADYWKPYVDISSKMSKAVYDQNENGIVDNAEKVNNHTVLSDVPSDAKYTDTKSVVEMDDVNVSSPETGEGLIWDSVNEEWSNGEITHPSRFEDLEDADFTSLSDSQIPIYNGRTNKWDNISIITTPPICTWADGTDEEIVAALDAYYNDKIDIHDYWTIGDERTVNLSAMPATGVSESHIAQTVTFVLTEIGGKTLINPRNGHTECAFQVDQKDCLKEIGSMDPDALTQTNRWINMSRRDWCNTVYKNAIPSSLRGIFKLFSNRTGRGRTAPNNIDITSDYFSLRAVIEVFGGVYSSTSGEGTKIGYYGNNTTKKKQVDGVISDWLLRSPTTNINSFHYVGSNAGIGTTNGSSEKGIAPYGVI